MLRWLPSFGPVKGPAHTWCPNSESSDSINTTKKFLTDKLRSQPNPEYSSPMLLSLTRYPGDNKNYLIQYILNSLCRHFHQACTWTKDRGYLCGRLLGFQISRTLWRWKPKKCSAWDFISILLDTILVKVNLGGNGLFVGTEGVGTKAGIQEAQLLVL